MRLASMLVVVLSLSGGLPARAEEPVSLFVNDRPPIRMRLADGSIGGTSALAAEAAFSKAGVPHQWRDMPASRQMAEIEQNIGRVCAVGFHRTPERERYALFTSAIDMETPMVAISGRDSGLAERLPLESLLGNPDILMEMKLSKSYGSVLDAGLKRARARIEWSTLNTLAIVDLIRRGRPIVTFISELELDYYLQHQEILPDTIRVSRFPELNVRESLHIICSRNVGARVIERLDRAIQQLGLPTS